MNGESAPRSSKWKIFVARCMSAPTTFFQETQLVSEPFRGRRLDQDRHENSDEGDRRDHVRTRRIHADQQARERRRNDAGLARPAHEEDLAYTPSRPAVRQGAQEYRKGTGHQHENGYDDHPANRVLTHQTEIDLRAEQEENK